jgi:DNA-binding NtrC family response regulator
MWEAGRAFRPAVPIGFVAELMRAPWTGNVRELHNLVERAARLNLHPGSFQAPSSPSVERREPAAEAISEPSGDAPVSERLLRVAGDTLGLAHKTVLKLLPPATLAALGPEVDGPTLHAHAAEALIALLSSHDFNQSSVAATLGVSRTTLIKLMDDLALPRAADLGADEIAAARAHVGGDVEAAARHLRVSPTALKKRITLLALKGRG